MNIADTQGPKNHPDDNACENISLTFIDETGVENVTQHVKAPQGMTLLDVAHSYNLPLEGVCGGCRACATCHVILSEEHFEKTSPMTDEEDDMLCNANGRERYSRLGCQVYVTPEIQGMTVRIPKSF